MLNQEPTLEYSKATKLITTAYSHVTVLAYIVLIKRKSRRTKKKSTSAFWCHDGNCCILSEISSSCPSQAYVLQLQFSDFHLHGADHLYKPFFAVHCANCTHFHPACICIQHTTWPHLTCKHTVYTLAICVEAPTHIKSSNLVCHQTIDSLLTWYGESYFLLSDLMPTTFLPPVKYSSTLST